MKPSAAFSLIQKLCKPLTELSPYVKAVWIYGSAVRKRDFTKGSDIDVLVLVDDTSKKGAHNKARTKITIDIINLAAERAGLKLHFQPPRKLTQWWNMVRSGEPWAITSMQDTHIIFDSSGYIQLLQQLLAKGAMYATQESAEKLLERSYMELLDAKYLLLHKLPYELLMICTETSQRVLSLYGEHPLTPKDTLFEMKKTFRNKKTLSSTTIDDYEELFRTVQKIDKGSLSEFNGKDLDRHMRKTKEFVKVIEEYYAKYEKKAFKNKLAKNYVKVKKLAHKALKKAGIRVKTDRELLISFEKNLVIKGLLDEMHLQTLKDMIDYKTSESKDIKDMARYESNVYIHSFEVAVEGMQKVSTK